MLKNLLIKKALNGLQDYEEKNKLISMSIELFSDGSGHIYSSVQEDPIFTFDNLEKLEKELTK